MRIVTTKIFLMVFFLYNYSLPQTSAYFFYQNGSVKSYNPNLPFLQSQSEGLNIHTTPLKVTNSKINILFSQDSLDLFYPGMYLYATKKSFNALDDGTGKKVMYGVKSDTGSGKITSYYFNGGNYNTMGSFSEGMYKKTMYTQGSNLPLTNSSVLNFSILHGGTNVPTIGSSSLRVYNKVNGSSQFNFNYGDNGQTGFFFSNVPSDESYPIMDLNNDGLNEIISIETLPNLAGWRLFVYNNFTILDSVDETRTSFFPMASTTSADLNGDGIPELITSVYGSPQFFQWNSSAHKFQNIATLPVISSMYLVPENVDSDPSKEIITQGGLLKDSLYIFDNNFNIKYKIKVPGIGIQRYFIQNVNDSPNKELIVVSQIGNPIQIYANATYIYDLSKGTDPIWMDSTFEAVAVGDFKNDGKNYILGVTTGKNVKINYVFRRDIRMIKSNGNSFTAAWDYVDSVTSFPAIAGPFTPSQWISLATLSFSSTGAVFNIKNTDLNGDGKNKFVFNAVKNDSVLPGYNAFSFYVLVNSDGVVVDTLPQAYKYCYALAADLNNDGRDELLLTQFKPDNLLFPDAFLKPKAWVYGYGGVTGIKENPKVVSNYKLEQNYPNPFNPSTTINFQIPSSSRVSLKVFDVLGREVSTLVNENKSAGKYSVTFDADKLTSGVYFYNLQAGNYSETKKMILIK